MKQWLSPQVNVKKFVANEYVSACADYVIPVSQDQLVDTYADLDYSNTYTSSKENIGTNTSRYFIGSYGTEPDVGLYEHVNFYKEVAIRPVAGDSYVEPFTQHGVWPVILTHSFTPRGTYNVYVYEKKSGGSFCWIYQDGYVPSHTPGEKAFS